MTPTWRYVDAGELSGDAHMRIDEETAIALSAGRGLPTLRLYRWHPWAISLGFNQHIDDIDVEHTAADGIDVVRRPTGGRAILHAQELTYSVVMEAGRTGILQVYNDISRALVNGLARYGVDVMLQKSQPNFREAYRQASSVPCFSSSARYEIEWNGRKLVGSAQRRYNNGGTNVVLQHGSILTGTAHRRLADYLAVRDEAVLARVRQDLAERTTDLGEITGARVDMARLATCIRQGFEESWEITFERSAEGSDVLKAGMGKS
jgi:lipoyl(octanoyl) transferase